MSGRGRSLVESSSDFQSLPPPRSSPFDKLAPETISEIFSFSTGNILSLPPRPICSQSFQPPSKAEIRMPMQSLLGLVCKKWLEITMAHHSLWATFEIDEISELYPSFSSQLRKYLQNSGAHSLWILVWDGSNDEVYSDILDATMGHSERWDRINFYFPMKYRFLQKLDAVKNRLPLLRHLHITGTYNRYPIGTLHCEVFLSAPSLNRISLSVISIDAARILNLPWNQFSEARFDSFSLNELREVLQTSKNLTTMIMSFEPGSSGAPDHSMSPVMILENLQVLYVYLDAGIRHLKCSSLKRLYALDQVGSAILKLLDNSACSLAYIRLDMIMKDPNSYDDDDHVHAILQHTSLAGLTYLYLAIKKLTDPILDLLIFDSSKRFPFLETLCLRLFFNSYQQNHYFESRIKGIHQIIQSRTYTPNASNSPGTPSHDSDDILQSNRSQSLKECLFYFYVERDKWEEWQDEKVEDLRLFCISRKVSVRVLKYRVKYLSEKHWELIKQL